jgi:hypothetical protein
VRNPLVGEKRSPRSPWIGKRSILLCLGLALCGLSRQANINAQSGNSAGFSDAQASSSATLAQACSAAQSAGKPLIITRTWAEVPTQNLTCAITPGGGAIKPAKGAVVTVSVNSNTPAQKLFDTTVGGAGSIILSQGYARPEWFGAVGNDTSVDSAPAINSAFHSMPGKPVSGVVEFQSSTYYVKTNSGVNSAATVIPTAHGFILKGNNTVWNTSSLPKNIVALQGAFTASTLPTGQTCDGKNWDCQYPYEGLCRYSCVKMNPVKAGDRTVTVADGGKFKVNHVIYLQGGPNGKDGEEPNAEQNVVTAINGNVLTLKWPALKPYPAPSLGVGNWPVGAVDIEDLTSLNVEIDDLKIAGAGGIGIDFVGTLGTKLHNFTSDAWKSDFVNGYNRFMTWDAVTFIARPGFHSCSSGGLFQVARNSADVTIQNSYFLGLSDVVCSFIAMNEGSANLLVKNSQFIGEGEVAIAQGVGGGFDIENNLFVTSGGWKGQGIISTVCCGTAPIPGIKIVNNRIFNYNTAEPTMSVGGPGAVISGNYVKTSAPAANAVNLANMSGGAFTGNTILTAGSGVSVLGGQTDFQITGNKIQGASVPNSICILYGASTPTDGGPVASQNVCSDFTFGLRTNPNMALFPRRAVGSNQFNNVTTPYTTGLSPDTR